MQLPSSLMGCLSSRSTIVPVPERGAAKNNASSSSSSSNKAIGQPSPSGLGKSNGVLGEVNNFEADTNLGEPGESGERNRMGRNSAHKRRPDEVTSNGPGKGGDEFGEENEDEDDMISILIDEQNDSSPTLQGQDEANNALQGIKPGRLGRTRKKGSGGTVLRQMGDSLRTDTDETSETNRQTNDGEGSVQDEATNIDLLRQYIMVDYEIGLLEDKDALRVYHEKIEQLEQFEQFERELDMIGSEAEEVATRADSKGLLEELAVKDEGLLEALGVVRESNPREAPEEAGRKETESNSMLSAILPPRSWLRGKSQAPPPPPPEASTASATAAATSGAASKKTQKSEETTGQVNPEKKRDSRGTNSDAQQQQSKRQGSRSRAGKRTAQYASVEEVFNRKIVLEKQRDKLKKEVELAIIECDKLQQRYKKRDEILDKLFEGRTGNGLENHLEQQLNWLLEQKHYVDQVYYVWKRAETLTNQTCEQFANALELIKKLPEVEEAGERDELVKNIGSLMIKSRKGMEQAQKYNPNVDAPFFTDNETERFDKIIEKISTNSLNQSEYSQILTVVQFAYKRAVSIRLWLEQILQTTIARDSFELAEEYKWIAIQLRKERINLIKAKLEGPPYRQMAQELREQMARQLFNGDISKRLHEINRDSGVGSETKDADLEEEVYRLLEINRSRFATSGAAAGQAANAGAGSKSGDEQPAVVNPTSGAKGSPNYEPGEAASSGLLQGGAGSAALDNLLKVNSFGGSPEPAAGYSQRARQPDSGAGNGAAANFFGPSMNQSNGQTANSRLGPAETPIFDTNAGRLLETPTRLRIELDEKAKLTLLQQVDQIHSNHKKRIERLRGSNKAIATSSLMSRLKEARSAASHHTAKEMVNNSASGSI